MARARDTGIPALNAARRGVLRGAEQLGAGARTRAGPTSASASSTPSRWSTSSPPTARTRRSRRAHDRGRQAGRRAGACLDTADDGRRSTRSTPSRTPYDVPQLRTRCVYAEHGRRAASPRPASTTSTCGSAASPRSSMVVRRSARPDVQLRLRDADGGPAGRRPVLLPVPDRRPEPADPARGQLVRRADPAQHRRRGPAGRLVLPAGPASSTSRNLGTTGPILDDPATPTANESRPLLTRMRQTARIRYDGAAHVVFNGTDAARPDRDRGRARVTTPSAATAATTGSRAATATTTSSVVSATTS